METDPLGNSFGAGGLFLTLSELHKFGLFYLNKGKWNGKQILSEKWIEESTKAADVGYYGYLFWRGEYNSFRADGKILPDIYDPSEKKRSRFVCFRMPQGRRTSEDSL